MSGNRPRTVVFTLDSLKRCLFQPLDLDWFKKFKVPRDGTWGVLRSDLEGVSYLLDERAEKPRVRIVIPLGDTGFFQRLRPEGRKTALQRIHRIAVQASRRQMSFPRAWTQYSVDNLLTVFAYQLTVGSERIVAEVSGHDRTDLHVCLVTTAEGRVDLTGYQPDHQRFHEALEKYGEAVQQVEGVFAELQRPDLPGVIDLEAIGFGAVTGGLTYSSWLPLLSDRQTDFVSEDVDRSVKLRGPAGTGKTLAMELKVLRECYAGQEQGDTPRILYVTHSWAVAEQVQESLEHLDERGILGSVDVFPLITLAENVSEFRGRLKLLGDDSFSGKEEQLKALSGLVEHSKGGDWIAFRSTCSEAFVGRVEAPSGTPDANRLLWDLMLEFACVIGANGILPGVTALNRYRQLERRDWMMPLSTDTEKDFVFHLYSEFVQGVFDQGQITTDQLINDYLNLLSTYRWHSERREKGYDLIFVDEFHLFNEQERMVFHHLTKDPNSHPVIFMALDPRQSPFETYVDFAAPGGGLAQSGVSDTTFGESANIDLDRVFRYTPEIHQFLLHLDKHFPALELGDDWGVSVANTTTARQHGEVPILFHHADVEAEYHGVFHDAEALRDGGSRVAVLCLDRESFSEYLMRLKEEPRVGVQVVESRDDSESLRYTTRSIVLSQPSSVAGLQFDAVVIAGCRPEFSQYNPNQSYGLRRFLSDLYLGASRAKDILHVHGSGTEGEYPAVIQAALDEDVLRTPG